jgi:hypothetical protein
MNRRWLTLGGTVLGALLFASTAHAFPKTMEELVALKEDLRPHHFFLAACVFGLFAIIGKYAEWSGLKVIGLAALCLVSAGTFLVWALTGNVARSKPSAILMTTQHAAPTPAQPPPRIRASAAEAPDVPSSPAAPLTAKSPVEPAISPAAPAADLGLGELCKSTKECAAPTVCAKVVGQKRCWPLCSKTDDCAEGFMCYAAPGQHVCVR